MQVGQQGPCQQGQRGLRRSKKGQNRWRAGTIGQILEMFIYGISALKISVLQISILIVEFLTFPKLAYLPNMYRYVNSVNVENKYVKDFCNFFKQALLPIWQKIHYILGQYWTTLVPKELSKTSAIRKICSGVWKIIKHYLESRPISLVKNRLQNC